MEPKPLKTQHYRGGTGDRLALEGFFLLAFLLAFCDTFSAGGASLLCEDAANESLSVSNVCMIFSQTKPNQYRFKQAFKIGAHPGSYNREIKID
jgi:hypothetical protein